MVALPKKKKEKNENFECTLIVIHVRISHHIFCSPISYVFLCCQATGLGICVQVVKNKLAPSLTKAELSIKFGKGIIRESEALDLACEHGVIVEDRGCYYIGGRIWQNREEVLRYLASNEEALDNIITTLRCHLFERQMA